MRRPRDGKRLDYQIVRWCEYVTKYHAVKLAYGLSFIANDKSIFERCDL